MTDVEERRCAYLHLYGVAQSSALIALKRRENAELATMAGMLHDIYSYAKMDTEDHAHKGAILAREILISLRITKGTGEGYRWGRVSLSHLYIIASSYPYNGMK